MSATERHDLDLGEEDDKQRTRRTREDKGGQGRTLKFGCGKKTVTGTRKTRRDERRRKLYRRIWTREINERERED